VRASNEARIGARCRRLIADRGIARGQGISFIAQHGRYGDLTSILNGADHFPAADDLYVAFADNLYVGPNPLLALAALPPGRDAGCERSRAKSSPATIGALLWGGRRAWQRGQRAPAHPFLRARLPRDRAGHGVRPGHARTQ
jgi:hypothetical protein